LFQVYNSRKWFLVFLLESAYDEFLKSEHMKFVERLHINSVLDSLLEDHVLSPSDHENIRQLNHNRKDQVRFLLMRLRRYGPNVFQRFKKILDIKTDIECQKSISDDQWNRKCVNLDCIFCLITKRVDVRDSIDMLYSKGLVRQETMEAMLCCLLPSETIWKMVFRNIHELGDLQNHIETIQKAIPKQYSDIKEKLHHVHQLRVCNSCQGVKHFPTFRSNQNTSKFDPLRTLCKEDMTIPIKFPNLTNTLKKDQRLEGGSKNDEFGEVSKNIDTEEQNQENDILEPTSKQSDYRRFGFAPESMSSVGTQTLDDLLRFHEDQPHSGARESTINSASPRTLRRTQSDKGSKNHISASIRIRRSQSDRKQTGTPTRSEQPAKPQVQNSRRELSPKGTNSLCLSGKTPPLEKSLFYHRKNYGYTSTTSPSNIEKESYSFRRAVQRSQSDRREVRRSPERRRRHTLAGMQYTVNIDQQF
jgi:hypothetical protein